MTMTNFRVTLTVSGQITAKTEDEACEEMRRLVRENGAALMRGPHIINCTQVSA